jgi:ABC-type branched-subunit amino acid transport system ATPase component
MARYESTLFRAVNGNTKSEKHVGGSVTVGPFDINKNSRIDILQQAIIKWAQIDQLFDSMSSHPLNYKDGKKVMDQLPDQTTPLWF